MNLKEQKNVLEQKAKEAKDKQDLIDQGLFFLCINSLKTKWFINQFIF